MSFVTDFTALKNSVSAYATLIKNKFALMMPATDRGALNGVAPLVNGLVPSQYLPSYVDDVLEYLGTANFPAVGENSKIYVDVSSVDSPAYRWTGTAYMQVNNHVSNADSSITAVRLATPRTISASGDANWTVTFDGSGNVTAVMSVSKINGVSLATLGTGLLKNTTGTGTPSIAAAGTDYIAPGGALGTPSSGNLANCTFPILNQDTTGTAQNAVFSRFLGQEQQNWLIYGAQKSLAMVQNDTTQNGSFLANASGTGDGNLAGIAFYHNQYGIKMGVRADGYFGLGGWSRAAWSWYSDPSGNMVAAGNVSAYSDPRLKDNVVVIENALDICDALDGVFFTWNNRSKLVASPGKRDVGLLANQVKAILPMLVTPSITDDETGEVYDTVDYAKMVPVLLQAIKDLHTKVRQLEGN